MYRGFRRKLSEHLPFENSNISDAHLKASLLLALFDGLYLQWYLDPEEVPLKEALYMAQDMLVRYYAIETAPVSTEHTSVKSPKKTVAKKSGSKRKKIESKRTSNRSE
nr:TetR family transcriptional regulator C-terminal domain-containing protein [Leptospira ellisii]